MTMWIFLLAAVALLAAAAAIFIIKRIKRFSFIVRIEKKSKAAALIVASLPVLLSLPFALIGFSTPVIIILHLAAALLLCDAAAFAVRKITKKDFGYDVQNVCALVLTVSYLCVGWFLAHHVYFTYYSFETSKDVGNDGLRIVCVADAHIGTTLDGDEFAEQMRRIDEKEPDVVVIAGDFVDDSSKKDDMLKACKALGELKTSYGVYLVYGNHDKGYYSGRDFSLIDLKAALEANGVTVLEDESVFVNDSFYITGRCDRSVSGRKPAAELTAGLDKNRYMIMLDHQPNDYDNEAISGADLVLSGHTHGGHMIPAGGIGLLLGANDRVYGTETRDDTVFVVTSGISGWGIPFKTGTVSEIVVIDINKKGSADR